MSRRETTLWIIHDADKVLCRVLVSLGQEQLVEMFNKVRKWYA